MYIVEALLLYIIYKTFNVTPFPKVDLTKKFNDSIIIHVVTIKLQHVFNFYLSQSTEVIAIHHRNIIVIDHIQHGRHSKIA